MNCSALHHHLFSKNIIGSPLCICGVVEDTDHYLFECERFNNLRQELFNSVSHICQPTIDVFLNDSHELTDQKNKQIFLAVQDFIVKSKRDITWQ